MSEKNKIITWIILESMWNYRIERFEEFYRANIGSFPEGKGILLDLHRLRKNRRF